MTKEEINQTVLDLIRNRLRIEARVSGKSYQGNELEIKLVLAGDCTSGRDGEVLSETSISASDLEQIINNR